MSPDDSSIQPEQLPPPLASTVGPAEVFARVFRRLGFRRPVPGFRVEYRPFVGMRSSIRLKDNVAQVHISDLLSDAPPLVLEALAEILLANVFRRRPSREARECYLAYVLSPRIRRRTEATRRKRGRKRLLDPRGRYFDLQEILESLKRRFFRDELPALGVGWTPGRSRTILGHYDSAHRTISISRWLDSPRTPRSLIEYLVFHEMLHARFPVERDGHRRIVHSRQFRAAEKEFPKYHQARRRLRLICP
ncbi:MAG: M48 family metallopeptidase [Acidobacteria bacterium]|nr:M48 family metallopeptidase [Acidobacteriota bacterium]MBI1983235.1 M48 family metallopeptidase [Acidobacteriota bacterium]